MRNAIHVLGLSAAILVAVACAAQDPPTATGGPNGDGRGGGIEGVVTGPEGGPIPGIRVAIVGGTAAFPEMAPETDQAGYYRIGGVPAGTFQVAAHDAGGRRVGQESVDVEAGKTARLDLSASTGATAPAGDTPVDPAAQTITPTDGLCVPASPLAVSVGDSWTIAGPVHVPEGFPAELPEGAAQMTSTFVVDVIGTTQGGERGGTPIERPTVGLQITDETLDADGNVLSSEDGSGSWSPASVDNLGPVLTPDWECHRQAWLASWSDGGEASVGERTLASGVTAVVFTVRQPLVIPVQGLNATMERHHGYDKATGRVVLQESNTTGTLDGQSFNIAMLQELAPASAAAPR